MYRILFRVLLNEDDQCIALVGCIVNDGSGLSVCDIDVEKALHISGGSKDLIPQDGAYLTSFFCCLLSPMACGDDSKHGERSNGPEAALL